MQAWEEDRIKRKGDGAKFGLVFPDFEEYFEGLRELAGEEGPGRKLPKFKKEWVEVFMAGHKLRMVYWRRLNEDARRKARQGRDVRAVL